MCKALCFTMAFELHPLIKGVTCYHAVGNYYLKYSWECFMQTIMHNIFLYCGQPEYFRQFSVVCWAGPTGRELPNIFPYLGVQEYFR